MYQSAVYRANSFFNITEKVSAKHNYIIIIDISKIVLLVSKSVKCIDYRSALVGINIIHIRTVSSLEIWRTYSTLII